MSLAVGRRYNAIKFFYEQNACRYGGRRYRRFVMYKNKCRARSSGATGVLLFVHRKAWTSTPRACCNKKTPVGAFLF